MVTIKQLYANVSDVVFENIKLNEEVCPVRLKNASSSAEIVLTDKMNFDSNVQASIAAHDANENSHNDIRQILLRKAFSDDVANSLTKKADLTSVYTSSVVDSKLATKIGIDDASITKQGNVFNSANQLVQLDATGKLPAVNGSQLNSVKSCATFATCSTASATAEKTVTLDGFVLTVGATILVTFQNANTAAVPTLNINSTGATTILSENGSVCSATNPFYVPVGVTVEFTYNGANWVYKNRVVSEFVNGQSWYRQYANGKKEQGGYNPTILSAGTEICINLLLPFLNTNYNVLLTGQRASSGTYTANPTFKNLATTYFVVNCTEYYGANAGVNMGFWEAKGY